MEKASKEESKDKIEKFFEDIKKKSPKEIRKIKKLAMKKNIKLGEKKKKFCKKCYFPYNGSKIRIKNGIKTTICGNCGQASRWRINRNKN